MNNDPVKNNTPKPTKNTTRITFRILFNSRPEKISLIISLRRSREEKD